MRTQRVLTQRYQQAGPILRRKLWLPLRRMFHNFNLLPLTGAVLIFFVLSANGQLRELYLSYLEELGPSSLPVVSRGYIIFVSAAAAMILLSAALHSAHFSLSSMKIALVYSNHVNRQNQGRIELLQRVAGICLAMSPWLGLSVGLLGAERYLARRYDLLSSAVVKCSDLATMTRLASPRPSLIGMTLLACALVSCMAIEPLLRSRVSSILGRIASALVAFGFFSILVASSGEARSAVAISAAAAVTGAFCVIEIAVDVRQATIAFLRSNGGDTIVHPRNASKVVRLLWTAAPWVAGAIYFLALKHPAPPSCALSTEIISLGIVCSFSLGVLTVLTLDRLRHKELARIGIISVIAAMIGLNVLLSFTRIDLSSLVSVYRGFGPLAVVCFEILAVFSLLWILEWLSHHSGFPALLFVFLGVVIIALFPVSIRQFILGLGALSLTFSILALMSRLPKVAIVALMLAVPGAVRALGDASAISTQPNSVEGPNLCRQFESWLDHIGVDRNPGTDGAPCSVNPLRMPALAHVGASSKPHESVYLFAVEGGGIYASAAASLLLSHLQDDNPAFAKHVFAISGVSGGSIGAAVFQALDAASNGSSEPRRTERTAQENHGSSGGAPRLVAQSASDLDNMRRATAASAPVTARVSLVSQISRIMQGDYLSAVVAQIVPEIFGSDLTRADALAASFEASVDTQSKSAGSRLRAPFDESWSPESDQPALVLNTTWVETGYRVAFSPFGLRSAGDQSLLSFSDRYMPGATGGGDLPQTATTPTRNSPYDVTLMEAALDSARFPGILPPYSVRMDERSKGEDRFERWNFVDGAYSDNSGSSTALALYRALEPLAKRRNVDMKLVILTSSHPQPDLSPDDVQINGTQFRDSLAPVQAVLNVRDGLSNAAVARACEYFYQDESCSGRSLEQGAPLAIIELDTPTFELPLGWKISNMTLNIVNWMLGSANLCPSASGMPADSDLAKDLMNESSRYFIGPNHSGRITPSAARIANSCVMKSIEETLR